MSHLKLINFFEDTGLNGLRFEMGARLVERFAERVKVRLLDEEAIRRLGVEGIDVDDFSDIKVEHDGTLSYKGKRIVVYIRDVKQYKDGQSLPKYHFSYCQTLEYMRQKNRWHRYVVANRDDGVFVVNFVGDRTVPKPLDLAVCQNCLSQIQWDGFDHSMDRQVKQEIVRSFLLTNFFDKFPKDLLSVIPTYTTDTAPLNDYSDDWGMISEKLKKDRGYTCEQCGRELQGSNKRFLHAHHKDGQKNNNAEANLEILCIQCHAEAPLHGHMKELHSYKEFVDRYVS